MSRSKRNILKQELLDEFEFAFLEVKDRAPQVEMSVERGRKGISFKVPRLGAAGFDVGATVDVYGIYPSAGPWQGAPWEPIRNQWQTRDVCVNFFAFVRILLSPASRLLCTYRRDKLRSVDVELSYKNKGWTSFERQGFFVLPFGQLSENCLQNEHLPARESKEVNEEFSPW